MEKIRGFGIGKVLQLIGLGTSILLPIYVLWSTFFPLEPLQGRAIFVFLVLMVALLSGRKKDNMAFTLILLLATILSYGYVILFHNDIAMKAGMPSNVDLFLGVVSIFVVIVLTQKTSGWPLTIVVMAFLLYNFLGNYIPMEYGGHGGFSLARVVGAMYLSINGIFGTVIFTMFKYVFLFVMLGKVLESTGALEFISQLARALVGRYSGGPALVAVFSSMLVGSVTGSAVANVMITGSISIPLMKKLGFEPHVAGAVEASASTGGQIMPPVMGAVAFLMAEFLGISYLAVVKAALIPALLFYISIAVSTYVYARRMGLKGLPKEELPSVIETMKEPGCLPFFGGLGTLMGFLIWGTNPSLSAIYSILVMIGTGFFNKKTRINFSRFLTAAIGVGLISSALAGRMNLNAELKWRILQIVLGVVLIHPNIYLNIGALIVLAMVFIYFFVVKGRVRAHSV